MDTEYDVVVIGGGPAGENAADYAVRGSDRTAAIVEGELLGGECSYWACMPSKALLRPLDVIAAANHLEGVSGPVEVDRDALLRRRDSWVSHYDDSGQVGWAEGAGIDVLRGRGRLVGERQVSVDGAEGTTTVTARQAVVLATGSTATVPDAFADVAPWNSRDVTGVTEVPDRLAIVGGGVVACESARWMRALGAEVTLLVRGSGLLPRAEPFAGGAVREALEADGVVVRTDVEVASASRPGDTDDGVGRVHGGPVTLALAGGEELVVDEVLVATGRTAATDGLGLDAVGLTAADLRGHTHGGPLPAWLYAVGDLTGVAPLTHWGKCQARLVGRRIAALADGAAEPASPPDAPVPQVVFTDPQVTWVGPTAAEAAAEREVEVRDADYTSASGAALLRDDATGRCRLVSDAATGRLLGATFVGPEVSELLHSATVAVTGGLDLATLGHAVASYPTASEVWLRLLEAEPERLGPR